MFRGLVGEWLLQSNEIMLCVAFAILPKLWEQATLPAPAPRIWDPQMKNTDTHSCSISTCLWTQLLGATISFLEKCALINILISAPSASLKFSCSVISQTNCLQEQPQAASPPEISHACLVFLSPKPHKLTLSVLLLCLATCLLGPRSPNYSFHPAIVPWLFLLTNQEPIGEQDLSIRTGPLQYSYSHNRIIYSLFITLSLCGPH